VAIATDITEALNVYCLESNNVHFAHIWVSTISNILTFSVLISSPQLTVIAIVSVAFAVISILIFYKGLKSHLQAHKPLSKLLAFKLIVGLAFIEKIIFTILHSTSTLHPTSTLSQADTDIGIPHLVICVQMVPFALFFPYAYSVTPYVGLTPYESSTKAWIGLVNPMELLRAMGVAIGMAARRRGRSRASKRVARGNDVYDRLETAHPGMEYPPSGPMPPPLRPFQYNPVHANSADAPLVGPRR
jgi:hypothetical protein